MTLVQEHVNILDFLSTDDTDELLEDCPFFRLLIHTARALRSNVYVDWAAVYNALNHPACTYLCKHQANTASFSAMHISCSACKTLKRIGMNTCSMPLI
jgi:hypothetical protein